MKKGQKRIEPFWRVESGGNKWKGYARDEKAALYLSLKNFQGLGHIVRLKPPNKSQWLYVHWEGALKLAGAKKNKKNWWLLPNIDGRTLKGGVRVPAQNKAQRWSHKNQRFGLCARCGKNPETDKSLCNYHLEYKRKKNNEWYAKSVGGLKRGPYKRRK